MIVNTYDQIATVELTSFIKYTEIRRMPAELIEHPSKPPPELNFSP